jgi:hypothetical protein
MTPIHYLIIVAILLLTFAIRRLMDRRLQGRASLEVQRPWRLLSYGLAAMWVVGSMCIDLMTKHGATPNLVIAAISAVALIGVAGMWAYYHGLEKADELVLKIEIEALALAFAFSIFGLIAAKQLVKAGIIAEPDASKTLLAMFIALGISRLTAHARYR